MTTQSDHNHMCECGVKFVPFKKGVKCPRCGKSADTAYEDIFDEAWNFSTSTSHGERPKVFTSGDAAIHFLSRTWERFARHVVDTKSRKEAEQRLSRFDYSWIKHRYSKELAKHSMPHFLDRWSKLSKGEKEKFFIPSPQNPVFVKKSSLLGRIFKRKK